MRAGAWFAASCGAAVVALALVAWASPPPDHVTDRAVYERTAADVIVPDCSDLQCFRVLVPWVLGRLPGPSLARWKAYAVLANAAAAAGVWVFCGMMGLSRRASAIAAVLSAFGFGALYTLHDPFTSDPLMFALGPTITTLLLTDRVGIAAALSVVGVAAKEFAAAPAYALALFHLVAREWLLALRAFVIGNAAFLAWALLTLFLMLAFNYGWGWNGAGSANLAGGAALRLWAERQSARGIAFAMLNEFGALYLLAPVGLLLASPSMRRLAFVSAPLAFVFAYVQQPDRALWNFHYLVTPLAALPLERARRDVAWATVALFAIGNLRVGAQLPYPLLGRIGVGGSMVLAVVVAATALRPAWGAAPVPAHAHEAGR